MCSPLSRLTVEALHSLSKTAQPPALAREAQHLAERAGATPLERGVALVVWGYSLLRVNSHQYRQLSLALLTEGRVSVQNERGKNPAICDWAILLGGVSWQLLGEHEDAMRVFDEVLSLPDVEISNRLKAAFSRAYSLYALGRDPEALDTYLNLAAELDRLPQNAQTLSTLRERQRVRLNLADHYLNAGQVDAAEAELAAISQEYMTPLMIAAQLAAQARVAMMRDRWEEAEQLANRANDAALEVNFIPLRLDALGVLVACAARQNRREEQHRLVNEMAVLLREK